MCQAEEVIKSLKSAFPKYSFSLRRITTLGDRLKNWQREDKGIFVKEIEEALIKNEIDLAVHSLKDLPSKMPRQLKLAAVTKREDPRDVLIARERKDLSRLKIGAVIGTSSLRRAAQIFRWRRDLRIENLRGNLDTRIRKLKTGKFDAIIVAAAGLKRLGYGNIFFKAISPEIILPAVGQGALGIQTRKQDKLMENIARSIDDPRTFLCVSSERAFLKEIGGGCRLPLGGLAQVKNMRINLDAAVISLDGKRIIRISKCAPLNQAEQLGKSVARLMLRRGARKILKDAQKSR